MKDVGYRRPFFIIFAKNYCHEDKVYRRSARGDGQ